MICTKKEASEDTSFIVCANCKNTFSPIKYRAFAFSCKHFAHNTVYYDKNCLRFLGTAWNRISQKPPKYKDYLVLPKKFVARCQMFTLTPKRTLSDQKIDDALVTQSDRVRPS